MDGLKTSALSIDGEDLRGLSLKGATIGVFDARGKKPTLSFLKGARFKELHYDATTKAHNDEGHELSGFRVVTTGGYSQFQGLNRA